MSPEMRAIVFEALDCAKAHEPDSRLIGNVRAGDLAMALAWSLEASSVGVAHMQALMRLADALRGRMKLGASVATAAEVAIGRITELEAEAVEWQRKEQRALSEAALAVQFAREAHGHHPRFDDQLSAYVAGRESWHRAEVEQARAEGHELGLREGLALKASIVELPVGISEHTKGGF